MPLMILTAAHTLFLDGVDVPMIRVNARTVLQLNGAQQCEHCARAIAPSADPCF